MAPNINNPPMTVLCINISFHVIPVPRNSGMNFKLEWVNVTMSRYILIHFYCLAVEAGLYSDVVECSSVNPASWVHFLAEQVGRYLLYDVTYLV